MSTSAFKIIPSKARTHLVRQLILESPEFLPRRIVIDYSSPNIAKPFHFGHLKSTILGNFLANIYRFYGHNVTKLNYIGDWGTQYGLLSLGLEDDDEFQASLQSGSNQSVLEKLVAVYIEANDRGMNDVNFYKKARERFRSMDNNEDSDQIKKWRRIRSISMMELEDSYKRIGIDFDTFEFESDYAKLSRELVEHMQQIGLVKQEQVCGSSSHEPDRLYTTEVIKNNKLLKVPILKSDGTSLYITRDIAAAINRHSRYSFDKMLYVVGADQERHFHCLREIVARVTQKEWANNLLHVKTGKVVGMSSRSGKFVLLSKIIDEATDRFIESTLNSPTSKIFGKNNVVEVAKHLATSSLFVYDMRNKRTRNYEFDWNQVMAPSNRSGIQLQGTYARLCSLIEKTIEVRSFGAYDNLGDIDYSEDSMRANYTPDAKELVDCLNEFSSQIADSYAAMDPSIIINHAFKLCRLSNRARRSEFLQVIREPNEKISRSRLTLFECSRHQLEFIIELIGLKPLNKI